MNIQEALQWGASKLSSLERPLLESEILLSFVLRQNRLYLHTHFLDSLEDFDYKTYQNLILRRYNEEPLEYLTQKVSFYENEFYVDYGVLIPRPETEILVSKAKELIIAKNLKNIAEIGIGSGAISLSLASLLPHCQFFGSDISAEALFYAFVNSYHLGVQNLKLFRASYLDFNTQTIKFDLLLSNPPYIPQNYKLPKNVCYEPKKALFGGKKGDEILRHIITLAYKQAIPYVICEIGYHQKDELEDFIYTFKPKKLEFYQDFAKLYRGFVLEF